jgi:hypothetical protein
MRPTDERQTWEIDMAMTKLWVTIHDDNEGSTVVQGLYDNGGVIVPDPNPDNEGEFIVATVGPHVGEARVGVAMGQPFAVVDNFYGNDYWVDMDMPKDYTDAVRAAMRG